MLFVLLSLGIASGRFVTTDFDFLVKLQGRIPTKVDNELSLLYPFASVEVMSLLLIFTLFLLPIRNIHKLLLLGLYGIGLIVVLAGKEFLHHPAPQFMFQRDQTGHLFPIMYQQHQYSYPSGHTFRTVFLASILGAFALVHTRSTLWKLLLIPLTGGMSFLVALSLITLGKHWLSDVVGGALLAVGLVCTTWLPNSKPGKIKT